MSVGDNRLYTNVIRKVYVREDQLLLKYGSSPPVFLLAKEQRALSPCSKSELTATLVTTCTQAMLNGPPQLHMVLVRAFLKIQQLYSSVMC